MNRLLCILISITCLMMSWCTLGATPNKTLQNPEVKAFIQEMVQDYQFDEKKLRRLFRKVHLQEPIIQSIQTPKEALNWRDYSSLFLTHQRIEAGVTFWKKYEVALNEAEKEYGVPPEVIVGILGIETRYGEKQGDNRVMDALATLAFQYPQRADFFKKELTQFLLLTRENKLNPLSIRGSYAGAFGMPQFMPSSYRHYAVDVGNKGSSDLIHDPLDAIASIANYLKNNGWEPNQSVALLSSVEGEDFKPFIYPDTHHSIQKPSTHLEDLKKAGVHVEPSVSEDHKAMLLQLTTGPEQYEYWLGFNNLYVIMRYNPSVNYAMAVFTLGRLVKDQMMLPTEPMNTDPIEPLKASENTITMNSPEPPKTSEEIVSTNSPELPKTPEEIVSTNSPELPKASEETISTSSPEPSKVSEEARSTA